MRETDRIQWFCWCFFIQTVLGVPKFFFKKKSYLCIRGYILYKKKVLTFVQFLTFSPNSHFCYRLNNAYSIQFIHSYCQNLWKHFSSNPSLFDNQLLSRNCSGIKRGFYLSTDDYLSIRDNNTIELNDIYLQKIFHLNTNLGNDT